MLVLALVTAIASPLQVKLARRTPLREAATTAAAAPPARRLSKKHHHTSSPAPHPAPSRVSSPPSSLIDVGDVDAEHAAVDVLTVELVHHLLRLLGGGHGDKAEPAGATRLAVGDETRILDGAKLAAEVGNIVFTTSDLFATRRIETSSFRVATGSAPRSAAAALLSPRLSSG